MGEGFPYTIISYKNAGECLEKEDRLEEAVECYKSAAEFFKKAGNTENARTCEERMVKLRK
ncbi:hypothetical protein DRQ17_06125 [bacterium]|nr:MAG: hypothetical protein DRQ17_06125 [bacterium]RKZ24269.1 MAG: hypothetical protein DRQ23_00725 [bacterium]